MNDQLWKDHIVSIDETILWSAPHLRRFLFRVLSEPVEHKVKVEVFCHPSFRRRKTYYKKNECKGMRLTLSSTWINL